MTSSGTLQPWEGKELGYGARLGLLLLSALLLIVAIVSFFIAFGTGASLVRGTALPDRTTSNILIMIVATGICITSFGGLRIMFPYTRGPASFTPAYGTIAPTTVGHPFAVRFQRYLWGRSLRGSGTVQFTSEGLTIVGHLEPNALFQIAIVLLVSILPQVLFGFGLGIIPALIIAYFVGRKQVTLTILATSVRAGEVKVRQVTLYREQSPKVITFAVAAVDGERLYRELQPRFPAALGEWSG